MQEQLSAATAEMVMLSTEESEKKKQPAPKEATANGSAKAQDEPTIAAKATPYEELVGDIKANLGSAAAPSQLKSVLSSSTLPPQDVMKALFEALFDGVGKGFAKEVVKNMRYLAAAVPDEGAQTLLVQTIEEFCSKCSAEALKEVPVVLKALYDGDVLEEETIVQWYDAAFAAGKNSQVLKNAKPFVEWLQSADSESEEGEPTLLSCNASKLLSNYLCLLRVSCQSSAYSSDELSWVVCQCLCSALRGWLLVESCGESVGS
uniref:eIF5 n=1 Tax=Arundo donax TaxID=35708 RepID=A0A0A9CTT3_ARUDO